MIVSPGRGYVFVHIPKTGGTSLTLALEERAMADDILIGDTPKAKRRRRRLEGARTAGRLWKHSTLADIRGLLPDPVLDALTPVTLVRNPWARMVSYHAWLGAQAFDHPAVALARDLPFAEFLRAPSVGAAVQANPVARYVDGAPRPPIFLRLEHLDQDMPAFAELLGFRPVLGHANASTRPDDWRRLYDAETRALVARLCAADIARFGYSFDV